MCPNQLREEKTINFKAELEKKNKTWEELRQEKETLKQQSTEQNTKFAFVYEKLLKSFRDVIFCDLKEPE